MNHQQLKETIQAGYAIGQRAPSTAAGRELAEMLELEFSHLEVWKDKNSSFGIGLVGIYGVRSYAPYQLRTASTLSQLVSVWRQYQGHPQPEIIFTSREAKKVVRLIHEAYEQAAV